MMNTAYDVVASLASGDDLLARVARSVITDPQFDSLSFAGEYDLDSDDIGTTDPFATDPSINELRALGVVTDDDLSDPVALSLRLAEALVSWRHQMAEEIAPRGLTNHRSDHTQSTQLIDGGVSGERIGGAYIVAIQIILASKRQRVKLWIGDH
jgi:hypothetical protein